MKAINQLFICIALLFIASTSVHAQFNCGNGICEDQFGEESPYSCPQDCGDPYTGGPNPPSSGLYCGDGMCTIGENFLNCGIDCEETPGGQGPDNPTPPSVHLETCDGGACSLPAAGVDADFDGIPDQLEFFLALSFFPNVMISTGQEDFEAFYGTTSDQTGGQTTIPYRINFLTTVASASNDIISICGRRIATCLEFRAGLPYYSGNGSTGDSEFFSYILMTETPIPAAFSSVASWSLVRGQYQVGNNNILEGYANCSGSTCIGSSPTSPRTIFVSKKKHNTFPGAAQCAATPFNNCNDSNFNARASIIGGGKLQNIGELTAPIDSVILDPDRSPWPKPYDILNNTSFGDKTPYIGKFFGNLNW